MFAALYQSIIVCPCIRYRRNKTSKIGWSLHVILVYCVRFASLTNVVLRKPESITWFCICLFFIFFNKFYKPISLVCQKLFELVTCQKLNTLDFFWNFYETDRHRYIVWIYTPHKRLLMRLIVWLNPSI